MTDSIHTLNAVLAATNPPVRNAAGIVAAVAALDGGESQVQYMLFNCIHLILMRPRPQ